MSQTGAAAPNRTPRSSFARTPNPTARPNAEPPRKQAEARSARDRFAAKLERDQESGDTGSRRASGSGHSAEGEARGLGGLVHDGAGKGSAGSDTGGDTSGGAQQDQTQAQHLAGALIHGVEAGAPVSAAGRASFDPAMLERMAAQIAESWPGSGVASAEIEFPDTAIAQSAQIVREPDGSIAVRIAGIDPRIAAVQNARLQLELANALAQRRLRVGSLQFVRAKNGASANS